MTENDEIKGAETADPDDLLTAKQVARLLGSGLTFVESLGKEGYLKKMTLGRRFVRYRRGDVLDVIARGFRAGGKNIGKNAGKSPKPLDKK